MVIIILPCPPAKAVQGIKRSQPRAWKNSADIKTNLPCSEPQHTLQGANTKISYFSLQKKKTSLIFQPLWNPMYVLGSEETCPYFIYRYLSLDVSTNTISLCVKIKKKKVTLVILFSTSKGDKFLIHSFHRCILKRSMVPIFFLNLLHIHKNKDKY